MIAHFLTDETDEQTEVRTQSYTAVVAHDIEILVVPDATGDIWICVHATKNFYLKRLELARDIDVPENFCQGRQSPILRPNEIGDQIVFNVFAALITNSFKN